MTETTAAATARPASSGGLTELGTPIPVRRLARWGFHSHIELLNGRIAMLGFVALVLVEWKLGHGILIQP
jgi:hypothetical protein